MAVLALEANSQMSITRQLLNEFRPLFQLLEDPTRSAPASFSSRYNSLLNDPFFNDSLSSGRPALDVSEEGNNYVVEVELPGVPKENVDIRIGDRGHSLTIEGKTTNRRTVPDKAIADSNGASSSDGNTTNAVATRGEQSKQLSTERQFVANTSFTRTVWLARPVDGNRVNAHLKDGILTLTLPKSEDKGSIKVSVE